MRALVDVLAAGVTNSSGSVVASGTVTFYESGTTTLTTAYQDYEGTTPHSNPATLDAAGRLVAWVDDRVKLVIADSTGATVRTIDGVNIADDQISVSIAASIAGNGLTTTDDELDVNVDDETITISSDELQVKDDGLSAKKFSDKGLTGRPGAVWNIGLENATTTNANDSIKITGYNGDDFSSTNIGHVMLPGTTAGTILSFEVTSNVTIRLDTAHWGLATLGNFTDVELRVYAINDNGTVKWGVSLKGGLRTIASSAAHAYGGTPTNVNTKQEMLTNSALTSGTWPCAEIGWFLADFNDTGDLWTVQTGAGEINVGIPVPDHTDAVTYTMTPTGSTSNPAKEGSPVRDVAVWWREGERMWVRYDYIGDAAGTAGTGTYIFHLPSGYQIDSQVNYNGSLDGAGACGFGIGHENASSYQVSVLTYSATQVTLKATSNSAGPSDVGSTLMSFGSNAMRVSFTFVLPIVQWSSN